MLVALFSAVELVTGDAGRPRAFARIAGQSVLERQVELAQALGAERFVVVSQGLPQELIAVQHRVEDAGGAFHAIAGPRALSGLLSSADDLVLFADGVLPNSATVQDALAEGRGVFALPADPAISQGFERIDRDRAWAGVLRTQGSDAARLADLPSDVDPVSALMRLSIQSGRKIIDLPPELLGDRRWLLVRTVEQATTAGRAIIQSRVLHAGWTAPFHALADRLVTARADRLHSPQAAARWTGLSGGMLLALAGGLGWYGFPALALGFGAGSAFLFRISRSLSDLAGKAKGWMGQRRDVLVGAVLDLALVAVLVLTMPPNALKMLFFPVAMMLGLLRLAGRDSRRWLRQIAEDRALLFALLAVGVGFGQLMPTIQGIAVLALLALLVVSFATRLTRA